MVSHLRLPGLMVRPRSRWTDVPSNPVANSRGHKGGSFKGETLRERQTGRFFLAFGVFVLLFFGVRHMFGMKEGKVAEQPKEVEDLNEVVGDEAKVVQAESKLSIRNRMLNPGAGKEGGDFLVEEPFSSGDGTELILRTCPDSQPLVTLFPDFIPASSFEGFKKKLMTSAKNVDGSLLEDNFGYTSGWMVRFNQEGIEEFRNHPKYHVAAPYFDMARNPEANAFVVNLLICHQPPEGENAVQHHLDNSVGIKNVIGLKYTIVAYQVNVLYVDIPEDMEGGALEVWPYDREETELGKAIVNPATNLMAQFRGDAYHRVGAMKLKGSKPRVGLVFEQYKLPSKYYPYTIPFCEGDQCGDIAQEE